MYLASAKASLADQAQCRFAVQVCHTRPRTFSNLVRPTPDAFHHGGWLQGARATRACLEAPRRACAHSDMLRASSSIQPHPRSNIYAAAAVLRARFTRQCALYFRPLLYAPPPSDTCHGVVHVNRHRRSYAAVATAAAAAAASAAAAVSCPAGVCIIITLQLVASPSPSVCNRMTAMSHV